MALDITFTLQDEDLAYFRDVMRKAQSGAGSLDESEILKSVKALSHEIKADVPDFMASRLKQLDTLVAMVEDAEWQIPAEERSDVISALAYFGESEDLIPDHIPALGFLDDAIMIELVVGDLRDNIDAFTEFCEFREREKGRRDPSTITSEEWLIKKRKE
eukprot:CAMPEP_0184458458 /NCGR_PEP_ID=MMETSP0740-20130409/33320_1 /TAXON_ID=385413 /ORGANISM="Thalassiosira miniscula, Strain CCMP1093" /LENGTH=159 /DNA_ID=CAMNT_0026831123 /DNA_START=88 /DNA_END=564 /DNA_ORIENTATION=+